MSVRSTGYGLTGPVGPRGPKGDTGADGPRGPAGPSGAKGDTGQQGVPGPKGDTGATGATGPQGPIGPIGATGPTGAAGVNGASGAAGAKGDVGPVGPMGATGATGQAGATMIGQVIIGQVATTLAISVGIREVAASLTGAVPGERYQCFCRSYRLNGGASVTGRPSGYAIIDCVSNAAGQVVVSLQAPLLSVGSSYALTCDIVKINAS